MFCFCLRYKLDCLLVDVSDFWSLPAVLVEQRKASFSASQKFQERTRGRAFADRSQEDFLFRRLSRSTEERFCDLFFIIKFGSFRIDCCLRLLVYSSTRYLLIIIIHLYSNDYNSGSKIDLAIRQNVFVVALAKNNNTSLRSDLRIVQ